MDIQQEIQVELKMLPCCKVQRQVQLKQSSGEGFSRRH